MYSRAHLIIQKQIDELNDEPDITIIQPNANNIFELIALVEGPQRTVWEKGVFQLYLKFNENYNESPPDDVYFQTIPYHPNIDIHTGRPSLDFLEQANKWKPEYTIRHILKSLQQLLANPLLDRSINMDAVFMLKGNPTQYETIVRHSVLATRKIRQLLKESLGYETADNADKIIYIDDFATKSFNRFKLFELNKENDRQNMAADKEKDRTGRRLKNEPAKQLKNAISYDDYCKMWKGIATTKSNKQEENIYVKSTLSKNPNLLPQHMSISLRDLEDHVNRQLNEHKNIMYGKFNFVNGKNGSAEPNARNNRNLAVNYNLLNEKDRSKSNSAASSKHSNADLAEPSRQPNNNDNHLLNDELFEQEVDELINWTKNI